jgi:hypothetical protein
VGGGSKSRGISMTLAKLNNRSRYFPGGVSPIL